ncbi:MAG: UxaA family hydrolase, partial [Nisaea sp.]
MSDHPRLIRMHPTDNVAVVANDGGLLKGVEVDGLTLSENIPQAHKVALTPLAEGEPVLRYGAVIGHAAVPIPAGSWVKETNLNMPLPPVLSELAIPSAKPAELTPLEGYTFQGFRNRDGSVGTRNILAITNTVQCVSGVVGHAVERIRREILPRFPYVDDVVSLDHTYGCGVAIDAPGA